MEIRPDHVAIYIRWSTDDQATGTTLEVQREGCEFFLRSQGWLMREDLVFIDEGYSGGNLDRPAMTRLRQKVAAGEVDCVVSLKIDRVSRNIVDAVDLVLREWKERCYIKSVREPIDTTTDLGRVIFGILAMFADFERATIRERTQTGKTRRIAAGKQLHAEPAFGYMRHPTEKGKWVENPDESPLLRRIFTMAAEGVSANAICRQLNQEGIRTRAGNEWSIRGTLYILHNRIYIGEYSYGRTSLVADPDRNGRVAVPEGTLAAHGPRKKLIRVTHEQPKVSGRTDAAPPLIEEAMFARVQAQLDANRSRLKKAGSKAMSSPHLLVGLARCTCGGALVNKDPSGQKFRKTGKGWRYYVCMRSRHGLCSENGSIPAEQADQVVEQTFRSLFGLKEQREERFLPRLREAVAGRPSIEVALKSAEQEMTQLDEDDRRLLREARSGRLAVNDLRDLRESVQHDRKALQERVDALRERLSDMDISSQSLQVTLEALDALGRWESLEAWQKRQLLSMVLRDRITISKPKGSTDMSIDIPWAF